MSVVSRAQRPRVLAAPFLVLLVLASLGLASAASAVEFGSHNIAPNRTVWIGPQGWFSGVYAAEDSCGCHTVGAGDAATGVSWNTGSSFRAYGGGCVRRTALIGNGTGSLYLWIHGHSDDVICAIAPARASVADATPAAAPATATATIAGDAGRKAWTSTRGDQVCIALQAADGYGQGCYDQADVAAGKAWTALGPAAGEPDQVTVATIVGAGAPTPVIERADGSAQALPVVNGIATAVVPASSDGTLRTWHRSVPLDPLARR